MGRPRTSEPRCHQLNLSLTAGEFDGIRRRAEALGMRPVHFARDVVLDEKRRLSTANKPHTQFQRLIYGQLARLGNNLNQLMRHLHRTGESLPADLEPLLADIRRIMARLQ